MTTMTNQELATEFRRLAKETLASLETIKSGNRLLSTMITAKAHDEHMEQLKAMNTVMSQQLESIKAMVNGTTMPTLFPRVSEITQTYIKELQASNDIMQTQLETISSPELRKIWSDAHSKMAEEYKYKLAVLLSQPIYEVHLDVNAPEFPKNTKDTMAFYEAMMKIPEHQRTSEEIGESLRRILSSINETEELQCISQPNTKNS